MAEKKLIFVIESTAAMGRYWDTLQMDYLNKIVRSLSGNEPSVPKAEFALVTYNTHGCYSPFVVQRSGCTRDPDVFLEWLSSIPFSGGGFNDGAIAEGLAEALMMFPPSQSGSPNQQNVDMHMHCILVAASNPHPLKTRVYVPKQNESIDSDTGNQFQLYYAEDVAKMFPQFSISLSVICPRQLLKIKAIYNAGKRNNGAVDPPVDAETTHNLILISEGFREACAALSCSGTNLASNQSHVNVEAVSVAPVMGVPPSQLPSVNGSIANQQPVPVGNVIPAAVKVEPVPVKVERGMTSSGPSVPVGNVIPAAVKVEPVPVKVEPVPVGKVERGTTSSQPLANLQGAVSMGQMAPKTNPGNLSVAQMLQGGVNMDQNVMNRLGQSGVSSGTGAMIPTPGMPQQVQSGMQPLANNAAATNMPLSQQTASAQPKYIKVWEGSLSGLRQGQSVFLTKLEGYRSSSASETLAANWPPVMLIIRLIPQDFMNNKQFVGKTDLLVFRAMNQHGFLGQLKVKKQCAVIQLPSQTLLLSVSDKPCRLIGMLFPRDMLVVKPPLSSQQQQQMQQQNQQTQSQQHLPQLQQQQQLPHMQQQLQGHGSSQVVSQEQVSSQGATNIGGGNFMS